MGSIKHETVSVTPALEKLALFGFVFSPPKIAIITIIPFFVNTYIHFNPLTIGFVFSNCVLSFGYFRLVSDFRLKVVGWQPHPDCLVSGWGWFSLDVPIRRPADWLCLALIGFDWLCFSPPKTAQNHQNTHKSLLLRN